MNMAGRKIAFIGAGSQKFVRGTVADLLSYEELSDSHLALMDIDARRLETAAAIVRMMVSERRSPITVESSTDLERVLDGADYVIITFMVGGKKCYESDTFIPARHGVHAAVGDTTGPGAVFRLIRTAPVLERIAGLLKRRAPNARVLNYANPMAMINQALIEYGHRNTVGFCHAVQSTRNAVAGWLNLPREEIVFECAGLNHLSFMLTLRHGGRDLYPQLRARADRIARDAEHWEADTWRLERRGVKRVRMQVLKYLGYLPVEPHPQGDYYPWFRKTDRHAAGCGVPTGWGYDFDCRLADAAAEADARILSRDQPIDYSRSGDFGIRLIHSIETGQLRKAHLNVLNDGAIANLPGWAVVEAPCLVDSLGPRACCCGPLPAQLAGVMLPHTTLHRLAVDGIMQKSRTLIRQAIQADPLTGAALTLPQIERMVDDMFVENSEFVDW